MKGLTAALLVITRVSIAHIDYWNASAWTVPPPSETPNTTVLAKLYIISLPGSDRWPGQLSQARREGLPFERVVAHNRCSPTIVRWMNCTEEEWALTGSGHLVEAGAQKQTSRAPRPDILRAQAGLASTIEAVVQFLRDPAAPKYGIVLEDDTALSTGFVRKLSARLRTMPIDWDVLHLCKKNTNQWTALPGNEHVASHGPVVGAPWPQRRDRNWIYKAFYTRALVPGAPLAFVAHRDGARRRCQRGNKNVAQAGQHSLELFVSSLRVFVAPSWTGSSELRLYFRAGWLDALRHYLSMCYPQNNDVILASIYAAGLGPTKSRVIAYHAWEGESLCANTKGGSNQMRHMAHVEPDGCDATADAVSNAWVKKLQGYRRRFKTEANYFRTRWDCYWKVLDGEPRNQSQTEVRPDNANWYYESPRAKDLRTGVPAEWRRAHVASGGSSENNSLLIGR